MIRAGSMRPGRRILSRGLSSSSLEPESLRRNAISAFGARITSAGFTAVLTLFLVRALDPVGYGLFGLAAAVAAIVALPADFGVSLSAARFVAERRADRALVAQVVATALRTKVRVTGAAAILLFAAASPIAAVYGEPRLTWVIRGFAISLLFEGLLFLLTNAFVAQGRTSVTLGVALAEGAVETGASIALVLLGGGAAGAAFGRSIGYLAGFGCALFVAVRLLGRSVMSRSPGGAWGGEILRYGGALFLVDSAYTLFNAIDVLVIGAFISATAVGLFSAPMKLLVILQLPAVALSTAVAPRMADGFAGERDATALPRAMGHVAVFQLALVAPLLVWAEPIVRLALGTGYQGSVDVLRALTPFAVLFGFGSMLSVTANYLGQARRRVPVALATVAINVVLDLILVPSIGVVGGAIGTDCAYLVYVVAHLWICRQKVDLPLGPLLGALARATAAAVAMCAVLFAFGTGALPVSTVIIGSSLALLAYLACLLVLGVFELPQRRHVPT